jgi:hypothetical protein
MKKVLCAVVLACCFLMTAGCSPNEPAEKWDRRPMVMVEGVIYMDTGKEMVVEIEDSAILGTIASSVEGSEMPAQNGQSNFGCEGASYAYLDDGLVVLLENEWVFFEKETE